MMKISVLVPYMFPLAMTESTAYATVMRPFL